MKTYKRITRIYIIHACAVRVISTSSPTVDGVTSVDRTGALPAVQKRHFQIVKVRVLRVMSRCANVDNIQAGQHTEELSKVISKPQHMHQNGELTALCQTGCFLAQDSWDWGVEFRVGVRTGKVSTLECLTSRLHRKSNIPWLPLLVTSPQCKCLFVCLFFFCCQFRRMKMNIIAHNG